MPWRCFMVHETGMVDLYLRRFRGASEGGKCSLPWGYHDMSAFIETAQAIWKKHSDGGMDLHCNPDVEAYTGDPRWPTHCGCGYEFRPEDHWQIHHELRWRADDGREWHSRDLPAGAMFYIRWGFRNWKGPDGKTLVVVLPPARPLRDDWIIDGPSSSGGHWTRMGIPPNVTASPSIKSDKYHGFLQNGMLTDSLADMPMAPGPD